MPRNHNFQFNLYRLNIINDIDTHDMFTERISSDGDIVTVLKIAASSAYDQEFSTQSARYKWSLREYREYNGNVPPSDQVIGLTFSRSTAAQQGQTVTEDGLAEGTSEITPPLSTSVNMFFYMKRHLVAVEHSTELMSSERWRMMFQLITKKACTDQRFIASFLLEPIPQSNEILTAFRSFNKIRRIRVKLLLPNPELSRRTQKLYDDMSNGGIREYLQDMRNADGLSTSEDALPFATASMAQNGYKEGDVLIEGVRGGRSETIRTGQHATRGEINRIRDFVRGIRANARSQEAQRVTQEILHEIDRLVPDGEGDNR